MIVSLENPEKYSHTNAEAQPRLIIHGGAGNITPANLAPAQYQGYRKALLTILAQTTEYMNTPLVDSSNNNPDTTGSHGTSSPARYPSALDVATYAVVLLENNPLFNSGHGAVFTRDGVNEMEASVMVSRGRKKRGVGAMGLAHVKNPILLAKALLEHGDEDLGGDNGEHRGPITTPAPTSTSTYAPSTATSSSSSVLGGLNLDVPSAQGHTLIFGAAAEQLAKSYGLEFAATDYFFTQRRWDEHIRALEREKKGETATATWSPDEYLPQGTCGAVAMDRNGVVCCATSTGGMTNKLTGRIGDTPVVGAGFWAEQFEKRGANSTTTVDMGLSGTGNGDSFLRLSAARQVGAIARYRPSSTLEAIAEVTGPGGELQKSAGKRWGKTGEGEGGMIAIEGEAVHDTNGNVVASGHEIIQEYNCGGMFRAWLDDDGKAALFRVWRKGVEQDPSFQHEGEGVAVSINEWLPKQTSVP